MEDRIEASFFLSERGMGDQVCVGLSRPIRLLRFDPKTAVIWAEALLKLAKQAERNQAGHQALTVREVDRLEEAICGTPSLLGWWGGGGPA